MNKQTTDLAKTMSPVSLRVTLILFWGIVDFEPLSGTAQVLASLRDRITTTPSIMMNMMTIMIAIY